jgi:hypothetical protein
MPVLLLALILWERPVAMEPICKRVQEFCRACEGLLSKVTTDTPLSKDETAIIEYYCKEIQNRIVDKILQ